MPVVLSCPSCDRKLRVPEDLLGKRVKCPNCKTSFSAEDPNVEVDVDVVEDDEPSRRPARSKASVRDEDEAVQERPRPARRQPREEEEDYSDEDEEDEEEERRRRRRKKQRAKEAAMRAVAGPAIGLIVTGCLGLGVYIIDIIVRLALGTAITSGFLGEGNAGPAEDRANRMLYGILVDLFFMIFPGIVITGAGKLKNVSSYGYGLAAAIVALLPCSGCCLASLPFGIWALIVMHREDVRRAFG